MNPLNFADKFMLLNRTVVSDGMGGWATVWTDGAEFDCLLENHSSIEARQAQQSGVTSLFTGTVDNQLPIEFNDVFKRLSDGETFRVTSNPSDQTTPAIATFQAKSFSAERFTIPG
jgi:hypothetical protein